MLTIKKDHLMYSTEHIKKDHEDYKEERVHSLIPFLAQSVAIDEDVTFGDVFNFIEKEKEMIEKIFASHIGWYPLQPYIDEIKKDEETEHKEGEYKAGEIENLEVSWLTHTFEYEGETEISIDPDFGGRGKEDDKEVRYAIDFTPLNNIKDLVVKLKKDVCFLDTKDRKKVVLEGYREFSVYDFLESILHEITFYGLPKERNEKAKEIFDDSDKKFIPLEETDWDDEWSEAKDIRDKEDE